MRRIGRIHNHTLKIKARVRAKGQRGSNWYGEKRVEYLRRKCRTSNLWLLQLSGDFHPSFETEPIVDLEKHHMMRAMLTANLAVDQRFANGWFLNSNTGNQCLPPIRVRNFGRPKVAFNAAPARKGES